VRRGQRPELRDGAGSPDDGGTDGLIAQLVLDHLYRLTDSTGIYQHAKGARPNPEFGYCVDDNARALIVAIRAHGLTGDNGLLDYVRHYLAFVERCQRLDGRFHNFMSAEGAWLDDVGSEDSQGRAVWALGFAARNSPQAEVRIRALECLDRALPRLTELTWLRARAFALLGLAEWQATEPSVEVAAMRDRHASALASAYQDRAGPNWRWFEDGLTYCNARLSQALLGTRWSEIGLESLDWLCRLMEVNGVMALIGNDGWYRKGGSRATFDQQPVDAGDLASACSAAYAACGEERFRDWAHLAHGWFTGKNVLGQSLIDPETGGCFDGLQAAGVNQNQGAESLLAWLLAAEDALELDQKP
jgi:hypothetical protein